MKGAGALLALDADIGRAEAVLRERQQQVRARASQARRAALEAVRHTLRPAALAAGAGVAALWLISRGRSSRAPTAPRTSARTAAFLAPLIARFLTPQLGRETATLVSTLALPFVFGGQAPPRTASLVRLPRYLGHWFEVARLPGLLEGWDAPGTTVSFLADGGGRLRVVSRQYGNDGSIAERIGVARVRRRSGNAKMRVTFAQGAMRWLPWAWSDQWIIDVAPDYSATVIGTPDRKRLWVLGRRPDVDAAVLERLLGRAAAQGYDVGRLVTVEHGRRRRAGQRA